jgi:hypothetical protein
LFPARSGSLRHVSIEAKSSSPEELPCILLLDLHEEMYFSHQIRGEAISSLLGMIGLHSPLGCRIIPSSVEDNGFSQSQEWPVGFDLNGELVVWEKDEDFWDGLPLGWTLDRVNGEESLAILDAMEDEFHRDKMIARQKTKGKRELLNLKSSINYSVASAPSRRGKGKALM